MNLLALLGSLPASDSVKGKLNNLDIQKTIRLWLVVLAGAFVVAFGQSISAAGDLSALDIMLVAKNALQAGVTATGAAAMELLRRWYASS